MNIISHEGQNFAPNRFEKTHFWYDELIIDLINPERSVFRWGSSIQCGHHKCHIHPQARNWHKVTRQQLMDGLKSKHWLSKIGIFSDSVDAACGENGDVQITELEFPFRWISPFEFSWIKCYFSYDDISIMFDNLGYGYNAVINGLSIFILKTQVNNSTNPKSDFLFM